MSDGWKYFDLKNLNELFSINYEKLVEKGIIQDLRKANGAGLLTLDVTLDFEEAGPEPKQQRLPLSHTGSLQTSKNITFEEETHN